ncbi:glycerate kinase type-2 family protein, partial [Tianweitania sp.]|uniref:glycerate kinase type-2 family protein n=1 Tax=Tianweitania sp. TaxID=2021634 RepID=UPI00289C0B6D
MKHKPFLTALFKQAVAAANPGAAIAVSLPPLPIGRTVVVGAGKAVLPMYRCLQEVWQGSLEGILVTGESQGMQRDNITILKGSHPLPDAHGVAASRQIQDLVASLTDQDLVIALISGGGSAMLPAPAGELTLEDEIAVNQALLASGAPISAMNTVRKHISTIKGGRLAASTQARVHTLVVSDIPGDVASQVASGPTLPDASTRQDALDFIERYSLELPEQVMRHIKNPLADAPIPGDPVFERDTYAIVASGRLSLQAALRHAEEQGINATLIADDLQGEASEVGRSHAVLTRE